MDEKLSQNWKKELEPLKVNFVSFDSILTQFWIIPIFILAMTQLRSVDAHKGAVKADRKIKEMEFTTEENKKNLDRLSELVDKLQGKIRT